MDKYELRRNESSDLDLLIGELQKSNLGADYKKKVLYNVDNCSCPECPCCDPDMKWLWPVGAGVLAASTPILIATVASE